MKYLLYSALVSGVSLSLWLYAFVNRCAMGFPTDRQYTTARDTLENRQCNTFSKDILTPVLGRPGDAIAVALEDDNRE